MTRTRMWWTAAFVAVPTLLACLALAWVEPPAPAAASAPPPRAVPVGADEAEVAPRVTGEPADAVRAEVAAVLADQPIRFPADSAELTGAAAGAVRRVAELLAAAPGVPVVVEGHVADTPGGPEAVQRLSDERAAVVADALVAGGVAAERITARGLGAAHPLATAEESRRVEITFG